MNNNNTYTVLDALNKVANIPDESKSGMRVKAESRTDLFSTIDDTANKNWYDAWYTSKGAKMRALRAVRRMDKQDKEKYGLNTSTSKKADKQYGIDNENANKLVYNALSKLENTKGFDISNKKIDGEYAWIKAHKEIGLPVSISRGFTHRDFRDAYFVSPLSRDKKETSFHELAHASRIDEINDKLFKPFSQSVKKEIEAEYGEDVILKEGFLGSMYLKNEKTGETISDKDFINKVQKKFSDFKYLQFENEAYPRIMQIRKHADLNPNEKVTNKDIDKIKDTPAFKELIEVFSEEQIINMLNLMVSNQGSQKNRG